MTDEDYSSSNVKHDWFDNMKRMNEALSKAFVNSVRKQVSDNKAALANCKNRYDLVMRLDSSVVNASGSNNTLELVVNSVNPSKLFFNGYPPIESGDIVRAYVFAGELYKYKGLNEFSTESELLESKVDFVVFSNPNPFVGLIPDMGELLRTCHDYGKYGFVFLPRELSDSESVLRIDKLRDGSPVASYWDDKLLSKYYLDKSKIN